MSTGLNRWRDWYERQVQPQPDGSFLTRPFGRFGGVYALPDGAAKDRYVAAQVRSMERVSGGPAFLLFLFVIPVLTTVFTLNGILPVRVSSPWTLVGLAFVIVLLSAWRKRRTLRRAGAKRVPRGRWTGPAIRDPFGGYSRTELLLFAIIQSVFGIVFIRPAVEILALGKVPGASDTIRAAGAVLMLVVSIGSWRALYRRGHTAAPDSGGGGG